MLIKNDFLYSNYSSGKNHKVAIKKSDICAFSEYEFGTQIFSIEAEEPILILMSFDEVKNNLTETMA